MSDNAFSKKIRFTYNKFFYDMVKDLKEVAPELKKTIKTHYKVKNTDTSENISMFMTSVNEHGVIQKVVNAQAKDVLNIPEVKQVVIMKEVLVQNVIDHTTSEYHQVIASFFLIFLLLGMVSESTGSDNDNDALFTICINVLRDMQNGKSIEEGLEDVFDDDIRLVLQGIDTVIVKKSSKSAADGGSMPGFAENTKIGSIAKEISNELDISSLNIEKPEDLLDFKSNNLLGNIVTKVGSKLQEKFESKEITHEELLKEAMSMIGNFSGNGGKGIFDNPIFKEMMKSQQGTGGSKGAKAKVDTSKLSNMAARERLRKKLEAKKNGASTSS